MLGSASAAGTVGLAEHQRLKQSHAALQDQFEAANEVLVALGRSAGDPDAVLTTIVESARRLRDVLLSRGYEEGRDLLWVEDAGGRHHESDWGRRFGDALPFLLTPTP